MSRYLCRMVAVHMARGKEPQKRIPSWLSLQAPWFTAEQVAVLVEEVTAIDDDTEQFVVPLPTADNLGWGLRVTKEEREEWRLTTIGAMDDSPAKRKGRRKAKARSREAARRESKGATPRIKSKAQTRPWAALGMSKPTWYRRGQPTPPPDRDATTPVKNGVRSVRRIRAQRILIQVSTETSHVERSADTAREGKNERKKTDNPTRPLRLDVPRHRRRLQSPSAASREPARTAPPASGPA